MNYKIREIFRNRIESREFIVPIGTKLDTFNSINSIDDPELTNSHKKILLEHVIDDYYWRNLGKRIIVEFNEDELIIGIDLMSVPYRGNKMISYSNLSKLVINKNRFEYKFKGSKTTMINFIIENADYFKIDWIDNEVNRMRYYNKYCNNHKYIIDILVQSIRGQVTNMDDLLKRLYMKYGFTKKLINRVGVRNIVPYSRLFRFSSSFTNKDDYLKLLMNTSIDNINMRLIYDYSQQLIKLNIKSHVTSYNQLMNHHDELTKIINSIIYGKYSINNDESESLSDLRSIDDTFSSNIMVLSHPDQFIHYGNKMNNCIGNRYKNVINRIEVILIINYKDIHYSVSYRLRSNQLYIYEMEGPNHLHRSKLPKEVINKSNELLQDKSIKEYLVNRFKFNKKD